MTDQTQATTMENVAGDVENAEATQGAPVAPQSTEAQTKAKPEDKATEVKETETKTEAEQTTETKVEPEKPIVDMSEDVSELKKELAVIKARTSLDDFLASEEGKAFAEYRGDLLSALQEDLQSGNDLPFKLGMKQYIFAKIGDKILADTQAGIVSTPKSGEHTPKKVSGTEIEDMSREEFAKWYQENMTQNPFKQRY